MVLAAAVAPPAASAQGGQPKAVPEDLLAREKEELRKALERLGKFEMPMAAEPAFRFEA
jgi:hypothetical protein